MVEYSSRLKPLIEQFQINPERNVIFQRIIEAFPEIPYQEWAIKAIFKRNISLDSLEAVINWVRSNPTRIKGLQKGNIVSYNKKTEIASLLQEIQGSEKLKLIDDTISKFASKQKEMLKAEIYPKEISFLEACHDPRIAKYYDLFFKFNRASASRKAKLYKSAANIHSDVNELISRISESLSKTYEWELEDCKSYILNNFNDCEIVFEKAPYLIVRIGSFHSSKSICGNSRTGWCITQNNSHWQSYVAGNSKRRQYFYFDFSRPEKDELAHIGFTVEDGVGIVEAQTCGNYCIRERYNYKGVDTNIHQILSSCGCGVSSFFSITKMPTFEWKPESFNEYAKARGITIACEKNGVIVAKMPNMKAARKLLEYSFIPNHAFGNEDDKSYYFVILDFNCKPNDENSIVLMTYSKDRWGIPSLSTMYNIYGGNIKESKLIEKKGLSTDDFLQRVEVKKEILLHKLIDEKDEKGAIKLIRENPDIDVNYEFESSIPIYSVILNQMYNLFKEIVSHKTYDCNRSNGIGGTLFDMLLYIYLSSEVQTNKRSRDCIKGMIDSVYLNKDLNLNAKNINGDTAICVASEFPQLSWIFDKLITRKDVDVNVTNDFGDTPLAIAITSANEHAVRLLCMRPDINIGSQEKKLAASAGIKISYEKDDSIFGEDAAFESDELSYAFATA